MFVFERECIFGIVMIDFIYIDVDYSDKMIVKFTYKSFFNIIASVQMRHYCCFNSTIHIFLPRYASNIGSSPHDNHNITIR